MDLRFDELKFPDITEKVVKVAPGKNFASVMTSDGKCFSLLRDESILVESGKLKNLRVIDINAGAQHVLVSTMLRNEDVNGNDPMLNQTYTINFKPITGMGNGVDNFQEPDTGENYRVASSHFDSDDKISVIELGGSSRNSRSRSTTLECKDTESSGNSSAQNFSSKRLKSSIRYEIEKALLDTQEGSKLIVSRT